MPQFNLPRLKRDGFRSASTAGTWLPVDHLEKLADSLVIGENEARRGDVKSIPDPWAQMLVFDRALFDGNHPLHEAVRSQWRALLTTLALQPEFDAAYSITFKDVNLGERDESEAGRSLFAKTLKRLEPKRILQPGMHWRNLTAVLLQERGGASAFSYGASHPIGFLTPTALIAAGRGADHVQFPDVPWLRNGLTDPSGLDLSERHFRILADYIEAVARQLTSINNLDENLTKDLSKALRDFHRAVDGRGVAADRGLVETPVSMTGAPEFHRTLLGTSKSFDPGTVAPTEADAALALSGPITSLFKGAILVDPALQATLGKRAESITVWGRHSLADAARPATFDLIRQEAESRGWLVLRPQDLFVDALVSLDGESINEAHPRKFESALLPLTPMALLLLPAHQIAQALDMSGGADKATVRLKLKLRSGKVHEVATDLSKATGAALAMPEDLAFWPNFKAPGWRWTFLHFTANLKYYLKPRFAVTAETIVRQVQKASIDESDRARNARVWSDPIRLAIDDVWCSAGGRTGEVNRISDMRGPGDEVLMERIGFNATDVSAAELHHLPFGADAIFFARKNEAGDFVPTGMALVGFPDAGSSAKEATIAVDFGTTNTVVYAGRNGKPDRLSFQDRITFPFVVRANQSKRRDVLSGQYLGFFPLQQHETPFPTVSKVREFRPALPAELQAKVREGMMHQHGFADNVLFVPNFDGFVSRQADLGLGDNVLREWVATGLLKFRLKWGATQAERSLAMHFLRQIMMMSAAELVAEGVDPASIDWRFSYPEAFSGREKTQLENELQRAWRELFQQPGGAAGTGPEKFLRKTEGAAAAHLFITDWTEKLMLMLDVGGGTTDIALWRDGKPFWRNSFKIAGGQFFTTFLANNPEILRKIDMGEVASGLVGDELGEVSRGDFVELYVNKPAFSERFARNFGLLASESTGLALEQAASVALGGLMYYVGLVIGELVKDPATGLKRTDLNRLSVAFAGRGSTLFRQMQSGSHDDQLTNLVRLAIAGAGFNPEEVKVNLKFSSAAEAKHEVAKGLLIDRYDADAVHEHRLTVLGEDVLISENGEEKTVAADQPLKAIRFADEIEELEMAQFNNFLLALRKLTGLNIELESRGAMDMIRAKTRQELADSIQELDGEMFDVPDAQPFEPPFITALRELVRLMARPLAERDAKIVVKES